MFLTPRIPSVNRITFPSEQRGSALGFWALANGSGHSLGPVISGFLVQYLGWPAIFWFNGTLTAIGALMVLFIVPTDHRRTGEKFDFVGAFTLTATMILLMFNINQSLNHQFPRQVHVQLARGPGVATADRSLMQLSRGNQILRGQVNQLSRPDQVEVSGLGS